MIWQPCKLLRDVETGKDELNNPIYELQIVSNKNLCCRHSPWTNEQITLEGREVTKNEQQFVLPIPISKFPQCNHAEIDGKKLKITKITDLSPRYTVMQVKVYKDGV